MSNYSMDLALMGSVLPLLFAVIVQKHWPAAIKQLVTAVLYLAVTIFLWLYHNSWSLSGQDWRGYVDTLWPVIAGGVVGYSALWRHTLAPQIEEKTTVTS